MEAANDFKKNGFAVIKNFLSPNDVDRMLAECRVIVDNIHPSDHPSIFQTGKNQIGDEYFLNSGDKISFFFEKDAVNSNGDLIVKKSKSLNKIGHALHWLNPTFKKITFSQKIQDLVSHLGYIDPVVVQSMFIFKHPKIGGEVVAHQDSTYLHTSPLSAMGLWFPLVDVSEENGCLWFIPGSHKDPVPQRFVRNALQNPLLLLKGEMNNYEDNAYISAASKKGDCVIIHGSVVHKSGLNISRESRPVYTFHIVERRNTTYSEQNWLQPSEVLPFPSLYQNAGREQH